MSASPTAYADRAVRAFVRQLRHSGAAHVVVAPGSRSTPLALAFVRDAAWTAWLGLDERSAAYFALGLARQRREPVALLCTSGTAAVNFAPAVAEASLSRVPLVVITADRPPELREMGANQTIDQTRLYGSHAKWYVELPIPDASEAFVRHAQLVAARAAAMASAAPAGAVHVNVPLREPLIETGGPLPLTERPIEVAPAAPAAPASAVAARCASEWLGRRGLIVCGPETFGLPAEAITELAHTLDWPVLADPLSGLRVGRHRLGHVIDAYDALLRVPEFVERATPEVVLRFGAAPTSKPLAQYLAAQGGAEQCLVDAAFAWRDPDASARTIVAADPGAFCAAVTAAIKARRPSTFSGTAGDVARIGAPVNDASWLATWVDANRAARDALREALDAIDEPFEGRAPAALAAALPDGATLVVGNSMPVRDADAFFPALGRDVRIVGTRGASGIDGVVSTAVGAAAARGGPVALLVGDLSFLHDLNGLWPLRRYDLSLTVLLVNNDGGGIFHFLPQAEAAPDAFEGWFGTPHGLDFRGAVEMHGGRFERLEGARGWEPAIRAALGRSGLTVLELRTDRVRNVALHRQVWAHVGRAVSFFEGLLTLPAAPTATEATR